MFKFSRTGAIVIVVLAVVAAFYWMWLAVHGGDPVTIAIHLISDEGVGEKIGEIVAEPDGHSVVLKPKVSGLTPGPHAFHVHENPSCEPGEKDGIMVAGLAAGGHFDPHGVMGDHGHTDHSGHDHTGLEKPAGDLPELIVDDDGVARIPVAVESLSIDQMRQRSIMIHSHGERPDNESLPQGGGQRVACGVIP